MTARVLLKARPTPAQLADRLRPPVPDGLELYLDTADLATTEAMDAVVARLEACRLPTDFTLLVEGPIRSLDGEFFDLSRDSEADRELSRRLIALSRRIGAVGANVHAIAPDPDARALTLENRRQILERAIAPTRFFADLALAAGITPTIENMPPILRMRESGIYFSAIGMPPQDLVYLSRQVAGIMVVLDTSHAQLYLNAQHGERSDRADDSLSRADLDALRRFVTTAPRVETIDQYLDALGDSVVASHVANAAGLLGEGLAYGQGDLDLDPLLRRLASRVRFLVTETLEADNDNATLMRDAQRRMLHILGRV